MPTTRPRHTITETPEIARALDEAARHWPDDGSARNKLLLRLIHEGHQAIRAEHEVDTAQQREAVRRTSGALSGVYPPGYLAELREDWPE